MQYVETAVSILINGCTHVSVKIVVCLLLWVLSLVGKALRYLFDKHAHLTPNDNIYRDNKGCEMFLLSQTGEEVFVLIFLLLIFYQID